MKTLKNYLRIIISAIFIVGLYSSCCKNDDGSNLSTKDSILSYFTKDMNLQSGNVKWNAYFDFSDGMQLAYADADTKEVLKGVVNKLVGVSDKFDMYSLADDSIVSLPFKPTDLYNSIISSASYNHQNAPIEKTLKKIVEEGRSALMVTDFEEYTTDKVVQHSAFATPYFDKWLSQGKDITFFVTDYVENGKNKHLYYIVFDDQKHKLLALIKDGFNGKPQNYKEYLLSTNAYSFKTNYLSEKQGGSYHDQEGNDNVTATIEDGDDESFFKDDTLKIEYYPFGTSWVDIVNNAKALSDAEMGKDVYTHLLGNLTADLSNEDSYIVKGLSVRVFNVEKDFSSYINNQIALAAEKPEKGEANDYYDENGKLLSEYQYVPSEPQEIKDMLVFDKMSFDSSKGKDATKVALNIDLDSKFSGEIVGASPNDMMRVDIVIEECEPNYEALPALFSWDGNNNLLESIKNTLQNVKPIGKPVYTYFLRTK